MMPGRREAGEARQIQRGGEVEEEEEGDPTHEGNGTALAGDRLSLAVGSVGGMK